MYVDLQQFAAVLLPLFSTLMEIPQGNTLENSGKQNPKMGFKSPPESRGEKSGVQQFWRLSDRFKAQKPRVRSAS